MNYKLHNVLNDYRTLGKKQYFLSPEEAEQQVGFQLEDPETYSKIRERMFKFKSSKKPRMAGYQDDNAR